MVSVQIGSVRLKQMRFEEALQSFREARDIVQTLGEPRQLADVWSQIGLTYRLAGHYDASEQAYHESLAIDLRENNIPGQAETLVRLGNLYSTMDRTRKR